MSAALPLAHFAAWLASGERGMSSEAIVSHLTGAPVGRWGSRHDIPYDPADLRRCEVLLRHYPLARFAFPAMREVSPQWAALVDAWDELVALAESEVPGIFDGSAHGSAPKTYKRMVELRQVTP